MGATIVPRLHVSGVLSVTLSYRPMEAAHQHSRCRLLLWKLQLDKRSPYVPIIHVWVTAQARALHIHVSDNHCAPAKCSLRPPAPLPAVLPAVLQHAQPWERRKATILIDHSCHDMAPSRQRRTKPGRQQACRKQIWRRTANTPPITPMHTARPLYANVEMQMHSEDTNIIPV